MVIKTPKALLPALHGRLVVDTINGKVRVRKWPEKRGPNVPPQVKIQNDRFAAAQRLAKAAKGSVMNKMMDATKGTGLYPRDLFTKLCLAPPFSVELEDGRVITRTRPQLETVMFQGFRLQRAATFGFVSGELVAVPWDDPIIDTAGFWNVADPTVVTVPEGVTVMEFTAGVNVSSVSPGSTALFLGRKTPTEEFRAIVEWNGFRRSTLSTGPIDVLAGEEYRLQVFMSVARTIQPVTTFLTGTILAAEV